MYNSLPSWTLNGLSIILKHCSNPIFTLGTLSAALVHFSNIYYANYNQQFSFLVASKYLNRADFKYYSVGYFTCTTPIKIINLFKHNYYADKNALPLDKKHNLVKEEIKKGHNNTEADFAKLKDLYNDLSDYNYHKKSSNKILQSFAIDSLTYLGAKAINEYFHPSPFLPMDLASLTSRVLGELHSEGSDSEGSGYETV